MREKLTEKINFLLDRLKKALITYINLIKNCIYSIKNKLKKSSKRKLLVLTYVITLAVFFCVVSFGYWPGFWSGQLDEGDIKLDNKEIEDQKRQITLIESEEQKILDKDETNESEDAYESKGSGEELEKELEKEAEKEMEKDKTKEKDLEVSVGEIPLGLWPLEGEVITEHNEVYQVNNQYRAHKGIDIRGPKGADVIAAWDGEVSDVTDKGEFGVKITIFHDNFKSSYQNLEESLVLEGDMVTAGEKIGKVGENMKLDAAQGSFLHFEVFSETKQFNPEELLQ